MKPQGHVAEEEKLQRRQGLGPRAVKEIEIRVIRCSREILSGDEMIEEKLDVSDAVIIKERVVNHKRAVERIMKNAPPDEQQQDQHYVLLRPYLVYNLFLGKSKGSCVD